MLDRTRQFERMIFQNPTIAVEDYPPLDDYLMEMQEMDSKVFHIYGESPCYIYVRDNNQKWFVDVYIYREDVLNKVKYRKRFIIAPGFQMTEEDEDEFILLVDSYYIMYDTRTCEGFIQKIERLAPDIHIKPYNNLGHALFHTYFASFRSGIRELLLKAGLEYAALELMNVSGWNIMAHNIEDAFGVPVKFLRKLNYEGGIEQNMSSEEKFNSTITVYKKYHNILNDIDKINEVQIHYLMECITEEWTVDKKFLIELGDLDSERILCEDEYVNGYGIYAMLKDYRELCADVNYCNTIFPKYPSIARENIDRFIETYGLLRYYIEYEEKLEIMMKKYFQKNEKYKFEDDEYEIIIPRTVREILEESANQHNCLYNFFLFIVEGQMTIMFMRAKSNRKKSLITIEVKDGEVKQALATCNNEPTMKEKKFIAAWADSKGLFWKESIRFFYQE